MSRARLAILEALTDHGPATRPELAEQTGVSVTAVHTAVAQLLEAGVLSEAEEVDRSGPGRPSSTLRRNRHAAEILAVDLGADALRVVHQGFDGTPSSVDLGVERADLIAKGSSALSSAIAARGWPGGARLRVLAIAVPGIVSADKKTILKSGTLGWHDVDLGDLAHLARADLLVVENDADAVTWGEYSTYRADGDHQPFLCVRVHVGIGAGLVTGDRLLPGADGAAGEVGYSLLDTSRPLNQRGQLEEALFSRLSSAVGEKRAEGGPWVEAVFQAAAAGDPTARAAIASVVEILAVGLSGAITMVNPAKIVLHWSVPHVEELVLSPLRSLWEELLPVRIDLGPARLGPDSTVLGLLDLATLRVRNRLSRLAGRRSQGTRTGAGEQP